MSLIVYCSLFTGGTYAFHSLFIFRYMKDLPGLFAKCFVKEPVPHCLMQYLEYCNKLRYDETPDYKRLRQMFLEELKKSGSKGGSSLLDWNSSSSKRKSPRKVCVHVIVILVTSWYILSYVLWYTEATV